MDLLSFAFFFFRFWEGFLSDFAFFSMRKQQKNRVILPLINSSMHASDFLVPERPIARF
jgi:hypothetical protein